jgi:hypothetical protein
MVYCKIKMIARHIESTYLLQSSQTDRHVLQMHHKSNDVNTSFVKILGCRDKYGKDLIRRCYKAIVDISMSDQSLSWKCFLNVLSYLSYEREFIRKKQGPRNMPYEYPRSLIRVYGVCVWGANRTKE